MSRPIHSFRRAALVCLWASAFALVAAGTAAGATGSDACPVSAYALALRSLTGPGGGALAIQVTTTVPDCAVPETLSVVQVTIFALKGHGQRRLDLADVVSPAGTASVPLGRVVRGQQVAANVVVAPDVTLTGAARTLLRPDLAVTAVRAARQVLSGRAFTIGVDIVERNRDSGTTATVTASVAGAVVATAPLLIAAGRRAVMSLPATLQAPGPARIDVAVTPGSSDETMVANNTGFAATEVTEFQVVPSTVLVPSLAGYGSQFNQNVYASISRSVGVSDDNVGAMEQAMTVLHPQFSRIFFSPSAFGDPDLMQSFVRTVLLAQRTGTTIDVTWQGGTLDVASGTVQKLADVLIDLVRNRRVTNLRWLTLQNEPNRTKMTPEQYEAQYRALDPYISSIRGQVRYMGGDLVRAPDSGVPNQQAWFDYLATRMADILDAYSVHVFWDYSDTQKLQDRLTEVRAIVDNLPEAGRKPLYIAEYGVRGLRVFNGQPAGDPGVWADGTPITQTNVSAFQHAWFDVLSARLGYVGTSKWDSYFGKYDKGTQAYYMIGSPLNGWPVYPLYNFVHLMTATVKSGWRVVGLDSVPNTTRLLAAYSGPKGLQWTVVGLDTAGAQLNAPSATQVAYSIGGLPPSRTLSLAIWNQAGDGLAGPPAAVSTDAAGVASVTVPQHAVFVLTTMPVR